MGLTILGHPNGVYVGYVGGHPVRQWARTWIFFPNDARRGKPDQVDNVTCPEQGATKAALPPGYHHLERHARPGTRVISRIAPGLTAPCRVIYVIDEPDRRGFAYGTLPGHPESGEEAFIVGIGEADDVWFTVRAFTRPGTLLARISGPFGRLVQRLTAQRYISAMRRLSAG